MVGNSFKVQGPVPNMVIYPKIAKKAEKIGARCSLLVMLLRNICRFQGPFLNMESIKK